jgi:hypothetical protein
MWDDFAITAPDLLPAQQDQARSVSAADWFFRLGDRVLDGIDRHYRAQDAAAIANPGRAVGMAPDGTIYVQGSAAGPAPRTGAGAPGAQSGQAVAFGLPMPTLLLVGAAAVALLLILRK